MDIFIYIYDLIIVWSIGKWCSVIECSLLGAAISSFKLLNVWIKNTHTDTAELQRYTDHRNSFIGREDSYNQLSIVFRFHIEKKLKSVILRITTPIPVITIITHLRLHCSSFPHLPENPTRDRIERQPRQEPQKAIWSTSDTWPGATFDIGRRRSKGRGNSCRFEWSRFCTDSNFAFGNRSGSTKYDCGGKFTYWRWYKSTWTNHHEPRETLA